LLASKLARSLGDEDAANVHSLVARACVEGIRATGDGSRERPHLVARESDEDDLVELSGRTVFSRARERDGARVLDRLLLDDGSSLSFVAPPEAPD
jgi:hypothetical protein